MPAGWKPGDLLPDSAAAAAAAAAIPAAEAPVAAAAAAAAPAAPADAKAQRPVLDASFLVLNPDLEEAVEEDYSSEEYSDSD